MNQQFRQRQFPAGNPLANALVVIVGALAIGASFVLGLVAFIALGSIVLVMAGIIGIRVWWMNRKLGRGSAEGVHQRAQKSASIDVIEGEYRDLSSDDKSQDRH